MEKTSEYHRNARECRQLAASADVEDQRDQLLRMAATWERMAAERAAVKPPPDRKGTLAG